MTISRGQVDRDRLGEAFREADVARCYALRPPYAPAVYDSLLAKVGGRERALDLGCGPGKIAVVLADHFREVIAMDPSAAMLEAGRVADAGRHANIVWTQSNAEDFDWSGRFDIVTAGTSIHWPEPSRVFPRMAACTNFVAVISGDEPNPPPCGEEAWKVFLGPWLTQMAERSPGVRREYDPASFAAEAKRHEVWMDIQGRDRFPFVHRQSLADFIRSQHSRATWSRAAMGDTLAQKFDRALEELMVPFARDGSLELHMVTELTWGVPRSKPRQP